MRLKLPVSTTAVSSNDDHQAGIGPAERRGQSLNEATRYLSAAAHLRKAMLPAQIVLSRWSAPALPSIKTVRGCCPGWSSPAS